MANVAFKSGLAKDLASAVKTEGTFYLTTDTHKLYVYRNSELIDLNHFIKFVSTQSQLFALDAQIGDFAYVINDNILVYKKSDSPTETLSDWTQVNPDTQISSTSTAVALGNVTSGVSVTTTVGDTAGNTASGAFSLVAGNNNVHLSQSGGVITITTDNDSSDHQYAIGTSASANSGLITMTTTFNGSTSTAVAVTVASSGQASVTSNAAGTITVDVPVQEIVNSLSFTTAGALISNATLGAEGAGASSTVTPTLSYGHADVSGIPNSTGAANTTAVFASGTAVLDVYTAGQVDRLIESYMQAADAMTYQGTVTSATIAGKCFAAGSETGTYAGNVGDVYKVAENFEYNDIAYKTGDLLIAKGKDGAVTWDIVESGDIQAVRGSVTTSSFKVEDGNSGDKFIDVSLAGSSGADSRAAITISGNVSTSNSMGGTVTYTFSHGDAGSGTAITTAAATTATTLAAATSAGAGTITIPVVTGISYDGAGHVTTASAKNYVITDTHANITQVDTDASIISSSEARIATTVSDTDGVGASDSVAFVTSSGSAIQFSSASVTIGTTTTTAISIDFVWGTF